MIRALVFWVMMVGTAWAVEPSEMLEDPALEERARTLSKELRCLVCRNESIDESHADLARDLRVLVRERLVAGDSDEEVLEFIVARFGEYVLLNPRPQGSTLILWFAGPALFLAALGVAVLYLRGRQPAAQAGLSAEEEARLHELLDK